jgi:hypothetical protein
MNTKQKAKSSLQTTRRPTTLLPHQTGKPRKERNMLSTINMGRNRLRKLAMPEAEEDSDVRRLIHTIVTDFNGDTLAYFGSIRPNKKEKESDKTEARIAHRFTKSI